MQMHQAIHKDVADEGSASDTGSARMQLMQAAYGLPSMGLFRPEKFADNGGFDTENGGVDM